MYRTCRLQEGKLYHQANRYLNYMFVGADLGIVWSRESKLSAATVMVSLEICRLVSIFILSTAILDTATIPVRGLSNYILPASLKEQPAPWSWFILIYANSHFRTLLSTLYSNMFETWLSKITLWWARHVNLRQYRSSWTTMRGTPIIGVEMSGDGIYGSLPGNISIIPTASLQTMEGNKQTNPFYILIPEVKPV